MPLTTLQTRRVPAGTRTLGLRPKWVDGVLMLAAIGVVGLSAVVVKELAARAGGGQTPLAAVEQPATEPSDSVELDPQPSIVIDDPTSEPSDPWAALEPVAMDAPTSAQPREPQLPGIADTSIRYFNGRPVRPARTIMMTVTAYSPDSRSCGDSADGITASLHRVETNGFRLVAADSRILPLGSMITVPGYDSDRIVPVLDRGGAIKGHRLDILFPTHEQARKWGVKKLPIVVWEYADGQGKGDWRRVRDSK